MRRSLTPSPARGVQAARACILALLAGLGAACGEGPGPLREAVREAAERRRDPAPLPGQLSAERGARLISQVGCGSCHVVPGIRGAQGRVGPPLSFWSQRVYIAGRLPNRTDNLVPWLMNPPAVEPGTAMPDLGLTEAQARDIAAYLYTLE